MLITETNISDTAKIMAAVVNYFNLQKKTFSFD